MNNEDLVRQARRMIENRNNITAWGLLAEASEFLRVYAGEKSKFFVQIEKTHVWDDNIAKNSIVQILEAFIRYAESGLIGGISIERKAQIDVVSDYLEQATILLEDNKVHPAAPAVIIGASLEEFLRNWCKAVGLSLGGRKASLESYAVVLKEATLITKQDSKDITAWGGRRNDAAHGEWDKVSDRNQISLMLDGVNLFMRKYGDRSS